MNKQLLIIGKPNASKTVFLTLLYAKLRQKKSKLRLYESVKDLSAITDSREAMAQGKEPQTTPTDRNVQILLPIQFENQYIHLNYPDYGGEQINEMISNRNVGVKWMEAVQKSDHWLFFIRINSINKSLDISNPPATGAPIQGEPDSEMKYDLSEQSSLIELLQILLDRKGYDYHFKNDKVKLMVVLTCWDELKTSEKPKNILKNHLPLLLNFVETNWASTHLKIMGLSAQGFALDNAENQEKYEIEGGENFGYVVTEAGQKIEDITELITETLLWK
jgi:Double-GTPase 1